MESDYDKKFAEMKKYIPFLENMIKKLEMSGTGSDNPRHAQLSKIKALRDLLQEKSKRMKMENLLKCEQVLVNLYNKVEQRDTLPGIQKAYERKTSGERDTSQLESVRNKLKKVTMGSESCGRDTLPEIDRANTSDFSCSPGSKEPALFQRRPNKYSSPEKYLSKSSERYPRNKYTRVLVSPQRSSNRWSNHSENDLYHRRSPRSSRSPRRRSPRRNSPHYKKDKKKKKDYDRIGKNKSSESVNIMLNVPEDTIESLNTSDICERIMNCEDTDVDINALRDLRNQIIKELKRTKVKDSLINKLLNNSRRKEIEEGELSDSESEAIERIYGSLVLVNNDKDKLSSSQSSGNATSKDKKVQICLKFVPKTDNATNEAKSKEAEIENDLDGNSYSEVNTQVQLPDPDVELLIDEPTSKSPKFQETIKHTINENNDKSETTSLYDENNSQKIIAVQEQSDAKTSNSAGRPKNTKATTNTSYLHDLSQNISQDASRSHIPVSQPELTPSGANFYKQTIFQDEIDPKQDKKQEEGYNVPTKSKESPKSQNQQMTDKQNVKPNLEKYSEKHEKSKQNPVETETESQQSEIPFLSESEMPITNKTLKSDGVTEIDILQALKNEILNEKIDIPGADSEAPALHQPKIITKVTDAKNISSKKKISLEKYKEQSSQSAVKPRIYKYKPSMSVSRGLTVKECERFNFPVEMALSDESPVEDEEEEETNKSQLYDDLIPKSPDHEAGDSTFLNNAPIIIPAEPLHKDKTVNYQADVDMRTLSPKKSEPVTSTRKDIPQETTRPKDPRLRKENPNSTPRSLPVLYPNMTPSRTPNLMPFEMTPSRGGFDLESTSSSKNHVYAPLLSYNDKTDSDRNYNSERDDDYRHSRSSTNRESYRSERSSHSERKEDYYSRSECPRTPSHYFGSGDRADGSSAPTHLYSRSDYNSSTSHSYSRNEGSSILRHGYCKEMPSTPGNPFDRSEVPSISSHSYGRHDVPRTPVHPFSRSDGSSTPIHSFGRSDGSSTPVHPFSGTDGSSTPIHPFSRSDGSSTPIHPFSRSDGSSTPIHPFSRSDGSSTPIHPFSRSDGSSTPIHPFSRSDGSSTPVIPFGRSNVSSTPTTFARSDIPTTPGRGEVPRTPVNPYEKDVADTYSRNDISRSTSQRPKDTYNRSYDSRSDYNSHYSRRYDDGQSYSSNHRNREKSIDRNHAYASDRYSSHSALHNSSDRDYGQSISSHSKTDRYTRERSIGRISESHDYSHHCQNTPSYVESDPRNRSSKEKYDITNYDRRTREQSVGRSYPYSSSSDILIQQREKSVSRQYEDQTRDRHGVTHQTNPSYYNEQSSKTTESRPFVRARSVGRMYEKDNTVSVHSHAGRSFTIDTSVNSTFQLNLPSEGIVFDKLFDARRQRAASVGRSLHDKGVTQTINREQLPVFKTQTIARSNFADSSIYPNSSISTSNKMYSDRFSRAKSVGREVLSSNKSLKDIRAEFELFRTNNLKELERKLSYRKSATENKDYNYNSRSKSVVPESYNNSYKLVRNSRKDSYEREHQRKVDKDAYSPRKNPRDPRFNRAQSNSSKRNNYVPPHERLRKDKKKYGMIYTDHNISHGNILGPMSGVKNYKIPKIKRPEPEIKPTEEKVVEEIAPNDNDKEQKSDDMDLMDKIDELICSPVRNTVSQLNDGNIEIKTSPYKSPQKMQNNSPKSQSPMITRSRRKNVVYDSDSDKEENVIKVKTNECSLRDNKVSQDQVQTAENIEPASDVEKQPDSLMFDDIDDEDTFFEKTSDDVINNINDLIAGLDEDISTKKGDEPISEKVYDSTLVKLTHSDADMPVSQDSSNNTILNEDNQISFKSSEPNQEKTSTQINIDQLSNSALILDTAKEVIKADAQKDSDNSPIETHAEVKSLSNVIQCEKPRNEDMVSTSNAGDDCKASKRDNAFQIPTSCSSPDSTINTEEFDANTKVTEPPKDEPAVQTEVGSDITSTNITVESTADSKPIQEERVNKTGLSSILNTIKDLLSKLDDPNEHEKIKLKLETLTKIVSKDDPCTVSEDTVSIKSNKSKPENCELDDKNIVKETSTKEDNIKDANQNADENETDIENYVTQSKKSDDEQRKPIPASPSVAQEFSDVNVEPCKDFEENGSSQLNDSISNDDEPLVRKAARKTKGKRRGKKGKAGPKAKRATNVRVTRSAETASKNKVPRELQQLHDDLRENMFINDEVISTTGIRTCRLAKLDDSGPKESSESLKTKEVKKVLDTPPSYDTPPSSKPLVVLEKIPAKLELVKPPRKKPGPKPKPKPLCLPTDEHKPGPKSKTNPRSGTPKFFEKDPFLFEYDSVSTNANESSDNSESEAETLASSISFNSTTESEKQKPKRKKRTWQQGVIRAKKSKKKGNKKQNLIEEQLALHSNVERIPTIPDMSSFTDKNCCFSKDVFTYSCKLCKFEGTDIVKHYKICHPHYEIPMSRMSPNVAIESIHQSIATNFEAMKKVTVTKYVCRFCFQIIAGGKNSLENFFWHVVSAHTGEFKHFCSECRDEIPCPFMLDTPPPPKGNNNLLTGYICEKCNFTQVSLENIKSHVSIRHNDEETEVYAISLGVFSPKSFKTTEAVATKTNKDQSRTLRSRRSNQNYDENSDDTTDNDEVLKTSSNKQVQDIKSRIVFEKDTQGDSDMKDEGVELGDISQQENPAPNDTLQDRNVTDKEPPTHENLYVQTHFKVSYTKAGIKEYVCCINGNDNHYKTSLLISMKKHIQTKHQETWDGYCYFCKVIVVPQGKHNFKDCFAHYLQNHLDNIPEIEPEITPPPIVEQRAATPSKPVINVRPISELLSSPSTSVSSHNEEIFPKIESIASLNIGSTDPNEEQIQIKQIKIADENILFEETQKEIMHKKHRVVLDTMMSIEKLSHIFKCAGRFCSFTCNSPEDALMHALTHSKREDSTALKCAYCSVHTSGNSIDLVSHVFKAHGCCQFACGKCFYRASAVQLVESHYVRAHGAVTSGAVIKASTVTPSQDNTESLTRNDAVAFYECCQDVNGTKCKFKTYTQIKFGEHYEKKHSGAQPRCQICDFATSDLRSLTVHLATHGLSLYQCTWCVYGGENETDILSHLSARHPSRRPQAYLRQIMETKDGTRKQLPMVNVSNKSSVVPIEITQTKVVENPVKEAERSAELETLIGQTMQIIENSNIAQDTPNSEETSPNENHETSVAATATTPTNVARIEEQITPELQTVKAEPIPISLNISEVVCLDSDDEDSTNITSLDISDDSNMATQLSSTSNDLSNWYKCGNCLQNYKNQNTFRNHIYNGHSLQTEPFKCYHCNFKTLVKKQIVTHYREMHGPKKIFECSICQVHKDSLKNIKRHCFQAHGHNNVTESLETASGIEKYLISPMSTRTAPKRKKTVPESATRAAKIRRYSPKEVDLLPIKQILDESVQCSICEFTTKVRSNIIRHLKAHEQQQPVPQIAPVNPVPHLESNEMYFDKMVNLASSSIQLNKPTQKPDNVPKVLDYLPPNIASRYPKYIPERQRYACGAKQCSYISIDEAMLKCHWDALHSGSNDFHCVHCPPSQELDKSQPLTAARIIAHLKMHDVRLFACSLCPYYHHQQYIVEKHLTDKHNGNGEIKIVRNSANSPQTAAPIAPPNAAPTMDLKPWQCGLCDFKSMLRQEVVEHCSQRHNSKFQYKCSFCPWRSSTLENVMKHQAAHAGMSGDIFYFYYREGLLPEDPNMPRWKKQRILMKLPAEPEVKAETVEATTQPQTPITIDLSLVKREVSETSVGELSEADLCKKYGEYCEPSGSKYLCPLCKSTTEDVKQLMQAHLYEELKYRKWSCAVCSYKSYHKKALQEHTFQEHRQNKEPVELAPNVQLEKWIESILNYQERKIILNYQAQKIKESSDKTQSLQQPSNTVTQTRQEVSSPRPFPSTSVSSTPTKNKKAPKDNQRLKELEAAFGSFGSANNSMFCCPKCDFSSQEESKMYQHLESELAKIRWCCTNCPMNFHVYHMAQLHCKSVHPGQSARATEAIRDPNTREQWIEAVIQYQKQNMSVLLNDNNEEPESLLMVRYEENVPIPDATTQLSTSKEPSTRRNRTSSSQSAADAESDDERLVIDEDESSSDASEEPKRKSENKKKCQYCDFETIYLKCLQDHTLRHYDLRPNKCRYCNFQSYYKNVEKHCIKQHPERAVVIDKVLVPDTPPTNMSLPQIRGVRKKTTEAPPEKPKEKKVPDIVCLICGCNIDSEQVNTHIHANHDKQIAEVNSVIVKCGICDSMRKTIIDIQSHHNKEHANSEINYAWQKLNSGTTMVVCSVEGCEKVLRLRDIDSHYYKKHPGKPVKYTLRYIRTVYKKFAHQETGVKRPIEEVDIPQKRLAKKSTTKLPYQEPRLMFDMDDKSSDSLTYTQEDSFGC